MVKHILRQVGIDEDRVWLRWIDASEGKLFSEIIEEMVAKLRTKGPNQMRKPWEVWQETTGPQLPVA